MSAPSSDAAFLRPNGPADGEEPRPRPGGLARHLPGPPFTLPITLDVTTHP